MRLGRDETRATRAAHGLLSRADPERNYIQEIHPPEGKCHLPLLPITCMAAVPSIGGKAVRKVYLGEFARYKQAQSAGKTLSDDLVALRCPEYRHFSKQVAL